jgi:hypothetical protein
MSELALLLETGEPLLLESGEPLLLEESTVTVVVVGMTGLRVVSYATSTIENVTLISGD